VRLDSQFVNLLAVTVRLHDLYDLRRAVGENPQPVTPQDHGRKNASGLWFEIGVAVLHYLLDRDEEIPGGFTPAEEIVDAMLRVHDVGREDVATVLNYLRTPCAMNFPTFEPATVLEQTALIEKAVSGSGFRIGSPGRLLCSYANQAQRLDYAPDVVSMLQKDLDHGRFTEFSQNCSRLVEILRDHTHKVVKVRERNAAVRDIEAEIVESAKRHLELLREVGAQIEGLQGQLVSDEVRERIEAFDARTPGGPSLFGCLHKDIQRVAQAANALLRNLSTLYETFHQRKEHMGALDLQHVLELFWKGQLSSGRLARAMSRHGFWALSERHCGLFDVPRKVSVPREKAAGDMVLEADQGTDEQAEAFFGYLRRHRGLVIELLNRGPLRLSALAQEKALDVKSAEGAASLVGVCLNLEWIQIPGFRILLSRAEGEKLKIVVDDRSLFVMDDLVMDQVREANA